MKPPQALPGKIADLLGRDTRAAYWLRRTYEHALHFLSRGRGVQWDINGFTYLVDPRFRHQLAHNYDEPVAAFFRERIRADSICIDVGANVGVYVLQFAQWSQPGGRVIAFEPNVASQKVLERHVRMNGLSERVTVVPAAVGDSRGDATLHAAGTDGMSRLASPSPALEGRTVTVSVPVLTLDDYCTEKSINPDWLLIDIEGFEFAALRGAKNLIRSRGTDLGIVVEMHPNGWKYADTTPEEAKALLDELGLKPIPLTGQKNPLADYGLVHLEHVEV